jgi:hypothetical protein
MLSRHPPKSSADAEFAGRRELPLSHGFAACDIAATPVSLRPRHRPETGIAPTRHRSDVGVAPSGQRADQARHHPGQRVALASAPARSRHRSDSASLRSRHRSDVFRSALGAPRILRGAGYEWMVLSRPGGDEEH